MTLLLRAKLSSLTFFAHQRVAKAAVAVMLPQQKTGGVLLFNASKQAVNPGADFGPYGLPKAATMFLSRQYAVDYGADGIRSNAVNADRIRSGLTDRRHGALTARPHAVSVNEDYLSREFVALRSHRRRCRAGPSSIWRWRAKLRAR